MPSTTRPAARKPPPRPTTTAAALNGSCGPHEEGDSNLHFTVTRKGKALAVIAVDAYVRVRTKIPARVASGRHTHPGEGVGYIVAGKVDMAIKGRSTLHMRAGDGFLIPPGVPHNALDIGPETSIMLST